MNYQISEKAIEDLEQIWLYTFENWSLEQADRYYKLIIQEIQYIAKHPESGKSIDFVRKGYKVVKVKSHIVCYKSTDEIVFVVRILHQRMDVENRLSE
jgi:toxin ParE1/3/4